VSDRIRVVVADDQNISRGFFKMYVRAAIRYELLAGLRTAEDAAVYVDMHETDLLILDVMMQDGMDGLTAAETIKRKHPEIRIILTTSASETSWEEKARAIGIESFWYKEYDSHSLIEIMDRTMNGESVYPGDAPRVPFGAVTRADLTDRELDILRELTGSLTNEEIAEKAEVSSSTVARIMRGDVDKDIKRWTVAAIESVLIGSSGAYPCAMELEAELPPLAKELEEKSAELSAKTLEADQLRVTLEEIHASYEKELNTLRAENQRKIDHLTAEVAHLRAENTNKNAIIAKLLG